MSMMVWLVLLALAGTIAYGGWLVRKRWLERARAAEGRMASFAAQVLPPATKSEILPQRKIEELPQQKLLFEAAARAAEAGEPALSIQLYARLIARYPDSGFAAQARAAIEGQKKKLAKG